MKLHKSIIGASIFKHRLGGGILEGFNVWRSCTV